VIAYLPVAFEHLERHELEHLPETAHASPDSEKYGLCSGQGARELFYATVDRAVVAGLEALGLPARRAWERRAAPKVQAARATTTWRKAAPARARLGAPIALESGVDAE
jgi:hypothetical protein